MQTTTFSSNEHIFEVKNSNDSKLVVKKYTLEIDVKKLNFIEEIHWDCPSTATVSLLGASCVIEFTTGSHNPVILVSLTEKSQSLKEVKCYVFKIDHGKLTAVRKFKTKTKLSSSTEKAEHHRPFEIIDGPSILVYDRHKVSCFYSQKSCEFQESSLDIKAIDVSRFQMCTCCSKISVAKIKSANILTFYNSAQTVFTFAKLNLATTCSSHSSSQCLETIHACHIRNGTIFELEIEQFLPVEYLTVVTSIFIKYINYVNCDKRLSNISNSLFIGTCNGFVLHITDGHVLKCIPMCPNDVGFMDTNTIHKMHITGSINNTNRMLICHEPGKKWTVIEDKYKVGCVYSDIIEVYYGDFTKDGSMQFLLMKDRDFDRGQWILTDLYSVDICNNEEKEQPYKNVSAENTGSVLQALNSRLQRDQVELEKQTRLYDRRTTFMKDLCAKYSRNISNTKSRTTTQTGLVPLVTGSGLHDNRGHLGSSESHVLLEAQEVWQRTFKDKWCVGVNFIKKCKRNVKVCLEMISSCSTSVKSTNIVTSKLISCPVNKTHSLLSETNESEIKKRKQSVLNPFSSESVDKLENKYYTLVSVTDLPDFSLSDTCSALLILHVTLQPCDSSTEELNKGDNSDECDLKNVSETVSTSNEEELLISGGKVNISCSDVVKGRHEVKLDLETELVDDFDRIKAIHQDKLALQNIQTLTHLTVKSTPGHLKNLESLLTTKAGFKHNSTLDLFHTTQTGLQNVQLTLEPVHGADSRNMDAYTSCERDLFVMLHHLYACLPDHVLILPSNPNSSLLKEHFLSCMNREIHFLSHGINKLLQQTEFKMETEEEMEIETNSEENLRKVGEKFKLSREKLIQKQSETLTINSTSEYRNQMEMLQRRTDLALAMINSK